MEPNAADVLNATIASREDLHPDLIILRVASDRGAVPEFKPGQFITIGLPRPEQAAPPSAAPDAPSAAPAAGGPDAPRPVRPGRVRLIRRAYSIASAAQVRDSLEFFLNRILDGELTPRLWERRPGDRLWMADLVHGDFTLDGVPPGRDIAMISTGTGIAPFLSMLRSYRGAGHWRRVVLVNGVRHAYDLGYRTELEELARDDPDFRYVPIVSRETEDSPWSGLRGHVQTVLDEARFRELAGFELNPQTCHVFLCGNPAMITDVQEQLAARGFKTHRRKDPGNLHFERYW
jgi:ferredoxin--NADP+ reductase